MANRGKLSEAWGRYCGDPLPVRGGPRRRVNFVESNPPARSAPVERDLMCDYIEGVDWWIARSKKSVNRILRSFDRGDVAICLYERVGAIVPIGVTRGGQHLIGIQLVFTGRDWDLDLCLSEAGIFVDEPWNGDLVDLDSY